MARPKIHSLIETFHNSIASGTSAFRQCREGVPFIRL